VLTQDNGFKTLAPLLGLLLAAATALPHPAPVLGQSVVMLPAEDRPLSMEADEIFSVGAFDGDAWETFGSITGLGFDEEGNLFILDGDQSRVVKVDSSGRLAAEMGRKGGGPGEFSAAFGFSVTPAGQSYVFDMGTRGFTVFNPDGTFDRTVPTPTDDLVFPAGTLLAHPSGGLVSSEGGSVVRMSRGTGASGLPSTRQINMFSLGEEVEVTSVYEGWNPAAVQGSGAMRVSGAGGIQISAPPVRAFDPGIRAGVLPGGQLAVLDSTTYSIKIVDPASGVTALYQRPFPPRKVTRRDREDEKARRVAEVEEGEGPRIRMYTSGGGGGQLPTAQARAMILDRLETMEFAEEMPVLVDLAVDWEGNIWVERAGDRVGRDGPIDFIAGDGRYLGSLAPGGIRIPDAFGPNGLAAFIERDELDVPRVVVRRLSIHP